MSVERINPNVDPAVNGDSYVVTTDEHEITLKVRPNGPQTRGFMIAFVSAEPPITESRYCESEVMVKNHEVVVGENFELSTMFPILSKTAFRALGIRALSTTSQQ